MKFFSFILFLLFSLSVSATDLEGNKVLLRGIDKITGRTDTAELNVGETTIFNNLHLTVQKCLKAPPEEAPENSVFLLIEEKNQDGALNTVFNGWMFSSNPALSAMDHPIFDIWVLDCIVPQEKKNSWENIIPVTVPTNIPDTSVQIEELADI